MRAISRVNVVLLNEVKQNIHPRNMPEGATARPKLISQLQINFLVGSTLDLNIALKL